MTCGTEYFDALSSILFSGPVKAADLKVMPGDDRSAEREVKAKALLDSMRRVGIVADNGLVKLGTS